MPEDAQVPELEPEEGLWNPVALGPPPAGCPGPPSRRLSWGRQHLGLVVTSVQVITAQLLTYPSCFTEPSPLQPPLARRDRRHP